MAVECTLQINPDTPDHGDVVTATYVVTGNDAVPSQDDAVTGNADVGGIDYPVSDGVTLPGIAALPETFDVPQCAGLVFVATSDPAVFTAVVP